MAFVTLVAVVLFSIFNPLFAHVKSLNDVLFSGNYDFVDLTYPFDNATIYWPGAQQFQFTKKVEGSKPPNIDWYAINEFAAGEHGGTHVDAPYHFFQLGQHLGDLSLDKLIVPLVIADVSSKVNDNPDFVLHKSDLDNMINDLMGKPLVLIFKFGWSKHYHDRTKYLGIDAKTGTLRFPGLSAEVAQWIVTSYKNVVGVGVDVASVDPGASTDFPVHQILSKAGLYNIENVNLNTTIHEYKCTALVLPMKIAFGTGGPLRLVAICPKDIPTAF